MSSCYIYLLYHTASWSRVVAVTVKYCLLRITYVACSHGDSVTYVACSHGDSVRDILMKKKLAVVDGQDPEAFDAITEEKGDEDEGNSEEITSGNSLEEEAKPEVYLGA